MAKDDLEKERVRLFNRAKDDAWRALGCDIVNIASEGPDAGYPTITIATASTESIAQHIVALHNWFIKQKQETERKRREGPGCEHRGCQSLHKCRFRSR